MFILGGGIVICVRTRRIVSNARRSDFCDLGWLD